MTAPLVVHVYHNPTGARLFAAPMVKKLNQDGWTCELWCDGGTCSWFGGRDPTPSDVPTRHLPCDLSLNPFRSLARLLRLLVWMQQLRPAVVHAHLLRSALLPLVAAWIVGVPRRIYHNHGLSHLGYRGSKRWLLRLLERFNRASATHLLMVSHSNRLSATQDHLKGESTVLANGSAVGLDVSRFSEPHVSTIVRQAGRERLHIAPLALVFGYAGRPAQHKGIDVLAQSWKRSGLADTGAHVLLAGVHQSELQALAGEVPPGMQCLGPLLDMPSFYSMCDCVVLPSRYEGFGYALLEGAAAGLPGIGSDVSGIRCAIVDGVTGLLVPYQDQSALADALIRMSNNPEFRARLGAAARERVRQEFRQETVLDALSAYYQKLGIAQDAKS